MSGGPRVWEEGCWDRGWSPDGPATRSPCQLGTSPGKQGRGSPVLSPLPHPCDAPALSPSHCQEGPVEPETFLRAAVQGKIRVIEKFLADGGPPDTCDEVASPMATGRPAPVPCHHAPPCLCPAAMPHHARWQGLGPPRRGWGYGWAGLGGDGSIHQHSASSLQFHRTALHRSSLEGHTDILQKLLDSGATVDFRDRVRPDPAPGSMLV